MKTILAVRSAFSLLKSEIRLNEYLDQSQKSGLKIVSLIDDQTMAGAMAFYKGATKRGLRAIMGMEFLAEMDLYSFSLIAIARNEQGFYDLLKLSSLINIEGYRFSFDSDLLKNCLLIVPSDNEISDWEELVKSLKKECSSFYLGLTRPYSQSQQLIYPKLRAIAAKENVFTIALPRAFYLNKEDAPSFEVLRAIALNQTIDDLDLKKESGNHFLNEEELSELYEEDDLLNIDRLIDRIEDYKPLRKSSLVTYKTNQGYDKRDYLINLAHKGLSLRLKGDVKEEYQRRLNYELKVIIKMHFEDYFLVVYDFILYAKKHDILVGPGRGSAAGSLVAYALGITEIDPLKYGLLFERFLNPERVSLPDIDTDFPDDKRSMVIDYVKARYGEKHVAHIVTYATLKARQVMRDVGRVLNNKKIDQLAKAIGNDPKITLREAYQRKAFQRIVNEDKLSQKTYELALKLEGLPRHISTHAAGIIMSQLELDQVIPLVKVEEDLYSSAYTMEFLEELGLIKMDFLGLRNLSIIEEVVAEVRKSEDFKLYQIPLDDQKTYDLIAKAHTLGVFQLESFGMKDLLKKMRPKNLEELAVAIALFRPGPIHNIPTYLANREHPAKIKYFHEDLESILKPTYGVIIYQEQIMMIAQKLAGFSLSKADILRKAMSKKKKAELVSLRADFIKGALEKGYLEDLAVAIYELILRFADYGFNKSHSIAYGLIAYQMAYLKAHHPLYFYKALLNAAIASNVKTYEYLNECLSQGIKLALVDINISLDSYRIFEDRLYMPFGLIKNLGRVTIEKILKEREKGRFNSFDECVYRLKGAVDRQAFNALIDGGAFDRFGLNRTSLRYNLDDLLKGDLNMQGFDRIVIKDVKDDLSENVKREKEVLGFNYYFNPLLIYKRRYQIDTQALELLKSGSVEGFGEIVRVREITTKTGEKMAYIKIQDDSGSLDLSINPRLYLNLRSELYRALNKFALFKGRIYKEGACAVEKLEIKG